MITFDEAVAKAVDHLSGEEIPMVITLQGRFAEGGSFVFNPENILRPVMIVRYLQVMHLL